MNLKKIAIISTILTLPLGYLTYKKSQEGSWFLSSDSTPTLNKNYQKNSSNEGINFSGNSNTVTQNKIDGKNLKKETSLNPRKELMNLGIQWTPDQFLFAIKNFDHETVKLFLQGGMSPKASTNIAIIWHVIANEPSDIDWLLKQFILYGFNLNENVKIWKVSYGIVQHDIEELPLFIALDIEKIKSADALIRNGADPAAALKQLEEKKERISTKKYNKMKAYLEDAISKIAPPV